MSSPRNTSTTRTHRAARVVVALGCLSALALTAACTSDSGWSAPPDGPGTPGAGVSLVSELRAVDGCDDLVESTRPVLLRAVEATWGSSTGSDSVTTTMLARGAEEDSSAQQFDANSSATAAAPAATGATEATGGPAADSATESGRTSGAIVGTNNQEQGVDEGDLVKTDGTRIVSVVDGVLRITVLDDAPAVDGVLDLTARQATQLFLRGDEALVIGSTYGGSVLPMRGMAEDSISVGSPATGTFRSTAPRTMESEGTTSEGTTSEGATSEGAAPETTVPGSTTVPSTTTSIAEPETTTTTPAPTTTTTTTTVAPVPAPEPEPMPIPEPAPFAVTTTVTRVSLVEPTSPNVLESVDLEGSFVAARMIDGRVRLVVRSDPHAVTDMMYAPDMEEATAAVDGIRSEDLLPRVAVDGEVRELGSCDDVLLTTTSGDTATSNDAAASSTFSPVQLPSTVTVVTVDDTLGDLQPVSVQGVADTVYASTDSLVVAAQNWDGTGTRTDLHRFALAGDGPASYSGSGSAPGRLLSQYSLSERDGALRVVTTTDATFDDSAIDTPLTTLAPSPDIAIAPTNNGAGRLTVLDTDGALDEVGHIDDLGVGEQVQSVRFIEDMGYVVTFRQVDPLFALDLSDPTAPRVLGELKIPGFSEYLHPVGDGLLLGVGREVDPETQMDLGLKISLFDISDPAAMVEVDQIIEADAYSPVGSDPLAFTWDPQRNQAVIPIERYCGDTDRCLTGSRGAALVVAVRGANEETRSATFEILGEFGHPSANGDSGELAPLRSVVVAEDLWTISSRGLGRTAADTPTSVDVLAF